MQRNSLRRAQGLGGHVPSKLGLYYGQCMTSSLGRRGSGLQPSGPPPLLGPGVQ